VLGQCEFAVCVPERRGRGAVTPTPKVVAKRLLGNEKRLLAANKCRLSIFLPAKRAVYPNKKVAQYRLLGDEKRLLVAK
jgi:hypothetical protein